MRNRRFSLAIVLLLVVVLGCGPTPTQQSQPTSPPAAPTKPESSATTKPTEEKIRLTVWWWGGQDRPALIPYMDEVAKAYEALHSNVDIEVILQPSDAVIPGYHAALEAGTGPDISTLWYGLYMFEDVFVGNVAPLNPYIPAEELKHWIGEQSLVSYEGQIYGAIYFVDTEAILYNKDLFAQAGLDPENPPESWDDFLNACETLHAAGIVPMLIGNTDGGFAFVSVTDFTALDLENPRMDLMRAVAGELSFTDPPFVAFWKRINEMRAHHCFSEEANSMSFAEARSAFPTGAGAMAMANWSAGATFREAINVGVMRAPGMDSMSAEGYVIFLAPYAPHPEVAADFLAFFHTPEVMEMTYKIAHAFPADDRFDASIITDPLDAEVYKATLASLKEGIRYGESYLPWAILWDGYTAAMQLLFADQVTPEEAAQMVEDAAQSWRELNPDLLEHYRSWAGLDE